MGGSDEEFEHRSREVRDRRGRDKFRGERKDCYRRSEERYGTDRRRDQWDEPQSPREFHPSGMKRYRENTNQKENGSTSPVRGDWSPARKRRRNDSWCEDGRRAGYNQNYVGAIHGGVFPMHPYPMPVPYPPHSSFNWSANRAFGVDSGAKIMLTFKGFLAFQEDNIAEDEARLKYQEYKESFEQKRLEEFFVEHKEEEWFQNKYHPDGVARVREERLAAVQHRKEVFMQLLNEGRFDELLLEQQNSDRTVNLLDTFVILIEGGTNEDLKVLDPLSSMTQEKKHAAQKCTSDKTDTSVSGSCELKEPKKSQDDPSTLEPKEPPGPSELSWEDVLKRYPPRAPSNRGSDNGSDEPPPPGLEEEMALVDEYKEEDDASQISKTDSEVMVHSSSQGGGGVGEEPRLLHRTQSLFLRFVPPTVTKQEIETMCQKFGGLKRVSLADPNPENRWLRRGWITFEHDVDIKKICLHLNITKLRDCNLGTIVNRDIKRRVCFVSSINSHKPVAHLCFKLAASLVSSLDHNMGLWQDLKHDTENKEQDHRDLLDVNSKNPVMKGIIDFLVEEAHTVDEEWLNQFTSPDTKPDPEEEAEFQRDDALLRALDRLLWYLRLVHSIDFYNHCEYVSEDLMPHRCGVIHVRGNTPGSKVNSSEMTSYCELFERKLKALMPNEPRLSIQETLTLGYRDAEKEIEKFIETNTVMLGKEKWLCQLSGKKFKAPEYVKKHIYFKFGDKVEEIRKETEFFNNYLQDPKRPQVPVESHFKRDSAQRIVSNPVGPPNRCGYGRAGYGCYPQPGAMMSPPFHHRIFRGGYRGRGTSVDPHGRPLISYRDLDAAPADDFI